MCKATVDEMLDAIGKVDPKKTIDIGGYRLEANGNRVQKSLPLTKSETYLTELMENICKHFAPLGCLPVGRAFQMVHF